MSRQEVVDFVCYDESGIYNLGRVIDELLPPTLERTPSETSPKSRHSFHDLLRIRSQEHIESRRRGLSVKRTAWIKAGFWLLGDLVIFAGGGAIGAGLMALRRGESITNGAGSFISCGLAVISLTLLVRLATKTAENSLSNAARV